MSKSFEDQLKVHSSTLFLANYIRDCNSTTRQGWSKQRYLFCCSCLNTYGVCRGTRSISTGIKDSFHKNAIIVSKREVSRVRVPLFLQPSNNHLRFFSPFLLTVTWLVLQLLGNLISKSHFLGFFLQILLGRHITWLHLEAFSFIHIRN